MAVRDGVDVRYEPASGPARRLRFLERATDGCYDLVTEEWSGCRWRETGREIVADVAIETADGELELVAGEP